MQQFWIDLLYVLLGIVIGAVIGFFAARKVMQKYIKELGGELIIEHIQIDYLC